MYDVIVVGARCAGAQLAMLLARKGRRVLVVDRATFPSDTMSAHAVKKPAVERLARWGLLDEVMATGCPPLQAMRLDAGPIVLSGEAPPAGTTDVTIGPRRTVLDHILVQAAASAGAEIREAFTVEEVHPADGEQGVVRGHHRNGRSVEEQCRMIVGADGRHSLVARTVAAGTYQDRGTLTCWAYAYWAGLELDAIQFFLRPNRFVIAFPTNDGLTMVAMCCPVTEATEFRSNVEGNYLFTLDLTGDLGQQIRAADRHGRFVSTAVLPNTFRVSTGPGWALAGDAGYQKGPITAEGISNAFRDADVLADAIDDGLDGNAHQLSDTLRAYEEQRNAESMPMFDLTCQLASLSPSPELVQLLGALPGNQAATDAFFGVIEGTTPVQDFFAPDNLASVMARA